VASPAVEVGRLPTFARPEAPGTEVAGRTAVGLRAAVSGAGGRTTALAADGRSAGGATGLAAWAELGRADSDIDEGVPGTDGGRVAGVARGWAAGGADGVASGGGGDLAAGAGRTVADRGAVGGRGAVAG
jgi:hypothetical protein